MRIISITRLFHLPLYLYLYLYRSCAHAKNENENQSTPIKISCIAILNLLRHGADFNRVYELLNQQKKCRSQLKSCIAKESAPIGAWKCDFPS